MFNKLFIILGGLTVGIAGFFLIKNYQPSEKFLSPIYSTLGVKKRQVVGFLPYWLLTKADKDYSPYLTTLTYFSLTISPDGSIEKETNPGEAEPGWHNLKQGNVDKFFSQAKKNDINLSLLVFSGNEETIGQLLSDPVPHAKNLIEEVTPLMKKYGFTDLNLDIESVIPASDSARKNFTLFTKEIKKQLVQKKLGTLTIDVSPIIFLKKYLVDPETVADSVDYMLLMGYDYHYMGSLVTGAVAPLSGGGIEAEFDTVVGVQEALRILPADKIILGLPTYGYEWETIDDFPHAAVLPGSGLTASNRRIEDLLANCASCSANHDSLAAESYLIYKDEETGSFHQFFYPDEKAMKKKVELAKQYKLGGLAVWALGYEGNTIMEPLKKYK
jgi:spore germination protein YaaH